MKKLLMMVLVLVFSGMVFAGGTGAGDPKCKECEDKLNECLKSKHSGTSVDCPEAWRYDQCENKLDSCIKDKRIAVSAIKACENRLNVCEEHVNPALTPKEKVGHHSYWSLALSGLYLDGPGLGAGVGWTNHNRVSVIGQVFYVDQEGCDSSTVNVMTDREGLHNFTGSGRRKPIQVQCPGCEPQKWGGIVTVLIPF